MESVIVLSLIIVATFAVLWYLFTNARIELDSPTIAAMEAHAEALEASEETKRPAVEESAAKQEDMGPGSGEAGEAGVEAVGSSPAVDATDYEYREMLEEDGENYVLPQWMVNFFSSSDICHTLDPADNVVFIVRLNDTSNAEASVIDISAECDIRAQTIALKLCFGEGAAAETFKTKFYLFERGDLFELNQLMRQEDVRIDVLTQATDYTFEYVCTVHAILPQDVLAQLKNALAKASA
ncbi:MAG: hypothetical protein JSV16_01665 [Candidatus Hydrogenedentota bacterium]|nr:MAG: hypothetical protein JSV16_01665 [Candidatus Hydrogenedentota bacterium]